MTRNRLAATIAVLSLAAFGCGSSAPATPGAPGSNALARLDDEPAGANCAAGGIAVRTGLDANANGVLDAAEVAATEYACNGARGAQGDTGAEGARSLVETADAPAGSPCGARGGVAIRTGLDEDRSGSLGPGELRSEIVVCDGATGETGAPGVGGIVTTGVVAPGGACGAAGGFEITTAFDASGDGVVQPGEVTGSRAVCSANAAALRSLVAIVAEPVGTNCAGGGQKYLAGSDADADGVLDANEMLQQSFVCNGDPGGATLVRTAVEPAGGSCPSGGQRVQYGLDANRNGTLGDAEVTHTDYVCNGAQGADGQTSLVDVRAEPAGSNCGFGGQAIESGLDANANATLDAGEIARRVFVCSAPGTLFASEEEPLNGANCPWGGTGLSSGPDLNANGVLEPLEATRTQYLCNGAPGATALVVVEPEPAGARCMNSGVAVRAGLDADASGALEPGEVSQVSYACNGTGGVSSLVRQDDEPAGGNCPYGGKAISSGLDWSGDRLLAPDEVLSTSHVCNGAAGEPGFDSLLTMEALYPDPELCPAGGQLVSTGLDTSRDGWLDPGEITNSQPVCGGMDRLHRVAPAQWGGVCVRGGVRIETGMDRVDEGVPGLLEDAEVIPTLTTYACNRWIAQLSAGSGHACAAMSDGTVRCWGLNTTGQLGLAPDPGDPTTQASATPFAVPGLAGVAAVAAGNAHTCARLTSGEVRCWGGNAAGQLGDGGTGNRAAPAAVTGLAGVTATAIATRGEHTCVVASDGRLFCWGANGQGQLGDGTTDLRTAATQVPGFGPAPLLLPASAIATGSDFTCAIHSTTTKVACWGGNAQGQLGDPNFAGAARPFAASVRQSSLAELAGVRTIAAGAQHACAILTSGLSTRCWGWNAAGQLGNGTTTNSSFATAPSSLGGALSLALGASHTCAALSDGTSRCFGANTMNPFGDGTATSSLVPVPAFTGLSPAALAAGADFTCALLGDGGARCAGANAFGQLGDGTTTPRPLPVPVIGGFAP